MPKELKFADKVKAARLVAERGGKGGAYRTVTRVMGLPEGTLERLKRVNDPEFMNALEESQKILAVGWGQLGAMALQELGNRMSDPKYRAMMTDRILTDIASISVQRMGDVDERLRVTDGSGKTFEVIEGQVKV